MKLSYTTTNIISNSTILWLNKYIIKNYIPQHLCGTAFPQTSLSQKLSEKKNILVYGFLLWFLTNTFYVYKMDQISWYVCDKRFKQDHNSEKAYKRLNSPYWLESPSGKTDLSLL